jgi:hypothetical protein
MGRQGSRELYRARPLPRNFVMLRFGLRCVLTYCSPLRALLGLSQRTLA